MTVCSADFSRLFTQPTEVGTTIITNGQARLKHAMAADAPMREPPTGVEAAAVAVSANIAAGSEGVFLPLVRR
ncbi:MAG: hypothetical protein EOM24_02735 [Chloroflexia bacterium]|nr:hypothetical protein [Chloroflexia bacterium]